MSLGWKNNFLEVSIIQTMHHNPLLNTHRARLSHSQNTGWPYQPPSLRPASGSSRDRKLTADDELRELEIRQMCHDTWTENGNKRLTRNCKSLPITAMVKLARMINALSRGQHTKACVPLTALYFINCKLLFRWTSHFNHGQIYHTMLRKEMMRIGWRDVQFHFGNLEKTCSMSYIAGVVRDILKCLSYNRQLLKIDTSYASHTIKLLM